MTLKVDSIQTNGNSTQVVVNWCDFALFACPSVWIESAFLFENLIYYREIEFEFPYKEALCRALISELLGVGLFWILPGFNHIIIIVV